MTLQDLIAYCIIAVAVVCFSYLAWASRRGRGNAGRASGKK